MTAMLAMRFAGLEVSALPCTREIGQTMLGTALGMYFTRPVLAQVAEQWCFLLAASVFCLLLAYVGTVLVARWGRVDPATAFFASVPAGALEMFNLSLRHGARSDLVAAAQSLRILLVVSIVPLGLAATGLHGTEPPPGLAAPPRADLIVMVLLIAGLAGVLFQRLRIPNAWLLGPLLVSLSGTAGEWLETSMPSFLVTMAQLFIGTALGARFDREPLLRAGRFAAAVCCSGVLLIGLSALFAAAWAWGSHLAVPAVVLATAPGGIAEMCLTAKALHYAVPFVTAAQVMRLVVVLLSTDVMFRHTRRWLEGAAGRPR